MTAALGNGPEALRDEGIAATTHAADPRVILQIDAAIADLNESGREWSANDLRDLMLPVAAPSLIGARIRAATMRRPVEMRHVGWVRSSLPSTHAKPIGRYIGVPA